MAQEEKELLLKDLSARLPYGVIVAYKSRESDRCNCDLFFKIGLGYGNIGYVAELGRGWWTDCKPYLRPMSSMTEEELDKYEELEWSGDFEQLSLPLLDWLNKKMFDYRGLIPLGLALKAPEGMYN